MFPQNTLQLTATHCNTLHHIATHCNTPRDIATYTNFNFLHVHWHFVAREIIRVLWNILHTTATHCNTHAGIANCTIFCKCLRALTLLWRREKYACTETHCNSLQLTATHCNTHATQISQGARFSARALRPWCLGRAAKQTLTLRHTANYCNILQLTATHTGIAKSTIFCTCLRALTLVRRGEIIRMHCDILQLTATHCNSLQLTATHTQISRGARFSARAHRPWHFAGWGNRMGWLRLVGPLKL